MYIHSFANIDASDFERDRIERVRSEINSASKDYILSIDEAEYKNFLYEKYKLEVISVIKESEEIKEPKKKIKEYHDRIYDETYRNEVYVFNVSYIFTGSEELFGVRPYTWTMVTEEIEINSNKNTVSFSFDFEGHDKDKFNNAKNQIFQRAFTNIQNANNLVERWNNQLTPFIENTFKNKKDKYLSENNFFQALNLPVDKNADSVFSVPSIKKKIIAQPTVPKNTSFSSEPTMSMEMYNDVLNAIYTLGKSMERKPTLYIGKNEEGLREVFLLALETRYDSVTATGETFNRSGKTDIMLKYAKDGTNLFVAECKFWGGNDVFMKAISQLFDRYLSWRDSKTALIMFVANKDFTNVLSTIKTEIKNHPYFIKETGTRGESSFSYIFRLPQDENKQVYFEVIAFHYDKIK